MMSSNVFLNGGRALINLFNNYCFNPNQMNKRRKIFEFVFVPAFTFLPSMAYAILLFVKGTEHVIYEDLSSSYIFSIVYGFAAIALIQHVLHKRSEGLRDLGLYFSWKQLLEGILLLVAANAMVNAFEIGLLKLLPAADLESKNIDFLPKKISFTFCMFLLVNVFNEELIARAFIIREMFSLTGSKVAAVSTCVIFQVLYHLYQGLIPALIIGLVFLIFSVFYVKAGRILPAIVAHICLDIIAVLVRQH